MLSFGANRTPVSSGKDSALESSQHADARLLDSLRVCDYCRM